MKLLPIYLYLGPENGRKKEALDELEEQITQSAGEPPEKHRLTPLSPIQKPFSP
jgi:DNA polymerase III delta subunit